MKHNISLSSLRSARDKTSQTLYHELALELLVEIAALCDFEIDHAIEVSKLKSRMKVTFSALAKMITILKEHEYINISVSKHSDQPNELAASITKAGLSKVARINLYSKEISHYD